MTASTLRAMGPWQCAAVITILLLGAQLARAQTVPEPSSEQAIKRFALFRTASLDPALSETGAALDAVMHEELNTLGHIEVSARPSVDLPAMQLAIDCVGELPECMRAVIEQAGVDALVAPVLRRGPDESLTVTLIYFQAHNDEMKGVTRTLSGRNVTQAVLDAVPEMVREAFGLPEPATAPAAKNEDERPTAAPQDDLEPADKRAKRLQIVVPAVLGAAGAVIGGVGLGLGIAAKREEDEYARAPTDTRAEIDAALASFDRAERLALAAHVSFGVAGAAVLSGLGVWLFTRNKPSKDGSQLTLTPTMSPSRFFLSLQRGF